MARKSHENGHFETFYNITLICEQKKNRVQMALKSPENGHFETFCNINPIYEP